MSRQTVQTLWRYPVKSMGGESVDAVTVDARGVVGDRAWAVITAAGKVASGKNTRRFERVDGLLELTARLGDGSDAPVQVQLPGGPCLAATDDALPVALSQALGRPLSLALEPEAAVGAHFDTAPVHVVTTGSLAWLRARVPDVVIDARRVRPNIVLDNGDHALAEQAWIGRTLVIGAVALRVRKLTERCVMTTFAQGDLAVAPSVLECIARDNAACLGVYADVVSFGTVRVGDVATVE